MATTFQNSQQPLTTEEQIEQLLNLARQKLQEGDGKAAIAYAINAATLKCNGNESEVIKCLDQAKASAELGRQRAIQRGAKSIEHAAELAAARAICDDMLSRDSILKDEFQEEGSNILRHAMECGSSVVCVRCRGLVSRDRFNAHRDMWCPKLNNIGDEDLEDLTGQMANQSVNSNKIPDSILYSNNSSRRHQDDRNSDGVFMNQTDEGNNNDGSSSSGYYCESF